MAQRGGGRTNKETEAGRSEDGKKRKKWKAEEVRKGGRGWTQTEEGKGKMNSGHAGYFVGWEWKRGGMGGRFHGIVISVSADAQTWGGCWLCAFALLRGKKHTAGKKLCVDLMVHHSHPSKSPVLRAKGSRLGRFTPSAGRFLANGTGGFWPPVLFHLLFRQARAGTHAVRPVLLQPHTQSQCQKTEMRAEPLDSGTMISIIGKQNGCSADVHLILRHQEKWVAYFTTGASGD